MGVLQSISTIVFLGAVVFYLYLYLRRTRQNVALQMWLTALIGLVAGLSSQVLAIYLGKATWNSMGFGIVFYLILLVYVGWKLALEWKKRH